MRANIFAAVWAVFCVSFVSDAAYGNDADLERFASVPEPRERVRQLVSGVRSTYDAALREYDEPLEDNPHDVMGRLRRCHFMEEFATAYDAYEEVSFVDEIYEAAEACMEEVSSLFPEHPEIQLEQLQGLYGPQRVKAAEEALNKVPTQNWTAGQMARLYSILAAAVDVEDKRGIDFARRALEWDETSDVRMLLANRLMKRGERDEVVRVLTSPVDGHDPQESWYLSAKMNLLAEVGAREHVLALHARLRDRQTDYDHLNAARALRQVGAIEQAREEFEQLMESEVGAAAARERFRFELDNGSSAEALDAYNKWRDAGWTADPLAINRIALLFQEPLLPWKPRDLLGIVVLIFVIAALGVIVCIPIALVHYRGLARRASSGEPYPQGDWTLTHAWCALFLFVIASILALYSVGPVDVAAEAGWVWGMDASPQQMARMFIIEALLAVTLLLPLGFAAKQRRARWWSSDWSVTKSALIGALVGFGLRVPWLLVWRRPEADVTGGEMSGRAQDFLWQLLEAVRDQFGLLSAIWLMAIFAPVIEEFVFRGVILRAFASHIRFGWANVIQAALFSAMHQDLKAAPMLFIIGLCAGTLARRSGGLLAPMVMHGVCNLIIGLRVLA